MARPRCLAIVATVCCLLLVGIAQADPEDTERPSEPVSEHRARRPASVRRFLSQLSTRSSRVPGTVVKSLHDGIPLRESAPGFLGLYGREIGKTKEGDLYLLAEGRLMQHFFRHSVWIKIVPIPKTEDAEENRAYWAYWGFADQDAAPNFVAVVPSELNDMNENAKGWVADFQHQLRRRY